MTLRRVAEELTQRLASVKDVSRAYVVGGRPRVVRVLMDPDRMAAHHVSPLELRRAIQAANVRQTAGDFRDMDKLIRVEAGEPFAQRPAVARSGRRRVRRPAGLSQGGRPGRGRAGGGQQLRPPRLGTGARIHRSTSSFPARCWERGLGIRDRGLEEGQGQTGSSSQQNSQSNPSNLKSLIPNP